MIFLWTLLWKSTLILVLITLLVLLLRRASAALRHSVRVMGMVSLLLLPVVILWLPTWLLPWNSPWGEPTVGSSTTSRMPFPLILAEPSPTPPAPFVAVEAVPDPAPAQPTQAVTQDVEAMEVEPVRGLAFPWWSYVWFGGAGMLVLRWHWATSVYDDCEARVNRWTIP